MIAEERHEWLQAYQAAAARAEALVELNARLVKTVQLAYRKHVLNDDTIGWSELDNRLQTTLAEAMGDPAFQQWLADVGEAS